MSIWVIVSAFLTIFVAGLLYAVVALVSALETARELKDSYLDQLGRMASSRNLWRERANHLENLFFEDLDVTLAEESEGG